MGWLRSAFATLVAVFAAVTGTVVTPSNSCDAPSARCGHSRGATVLMDTRTGEVLSRYLTGTSKAVYIRMDTRTGEVLR